MGITVRVYSVRSQADARAMECGEQGYYYTVMLYTSEGKPMDVRRVCTVLVEFDMVKPDIDIYIDAVAVKFGKGYAMIYLKREEVIG